MIRSPFAVSFLGQLCHIEDFCVRTEASRDQIVVARGEEGFSMTRSAEA
jgi:hypothetical protein